MRKFLVILALLGGAYWWFSKPRTAAVPVQGHSTPAPAMAASSTTPPPAAQGSTVRKSPMNSAVNLRQAQAERVKKSP
jgi:hypothetical protein